MNIHEYIRLTRKNNEKALLSTQKAIFEFADKDSAKLNEKPTMLTNKMGLNSSIYEFAKRAFKDTDFSVEMSTIYSNYVYPEILIDKNKAYILWDLCFWSLCEKYIKYIYFLNDLNEHDICKGFGETITEQYLQDMLYFLSNKLLVYDGLSYSLALEYSIRRGHLLQRWTVYGGGDLDEVFTHIQLIALLHERNHFLFKYNKTALDECHKQFVDIMKLNVNPHRTNFDNVQNECYRKAFDTIIHDKHSKVVEETLCDFRAVTEIMQMIMITEQSHKADKIRIVFKSFLFLKMFQSNMSIVLDEWENIACSLYGKQQSISSVTEMEDMLIKNLICEQVVKTMGILTLKDDPNYEECDKFVDLDYSILRNAVRQLLKDEFINWITSQVDVKQGYTNESKIEECLNEYRT